MGYVLKAFVAELEIIQVFSNHYRKAQMVKLNQGLGLIPMTETLFDEITAQEMNDDVPGFVLMTSGIENQVLTLHPIGKIAYVEAEYFGGQGSQSALVWENGRRSKIFTNTPNAINNALNALGVFRVENKDEFDVLNLGRYRDTYEWTESQP